ncbi:MAG TPA: hypothetical protein VF713_12555, partial [Thermoanaerobaculia bacterium]
RIANRYMEDREKDEPNSYSDAERVVMVRAALLLAFFHDAFHPPFGHVLDPLRPILLPRVESRRIDNAVKALEFERAARGEGTIHRLVVSRIYDSITLKSIAKQCVALMKAAEPNLGRTDGIERRYGFLLDILWGPIDHDRLDYIARDVAHVLTFETLPPTFGDLESFADVRYHADSDSVRFVFNAAVGEKVENLLLTRQRMYGEIYEGRLKAAYDELILHAVIFALDAYEQFEQRLKIRRDTPEWEFGLDFTRLSDLDLVRLLGELPVRPKTWLAKTLLRNLLTNAPFVAAETVEIDNDELPFLGVRYMQWRGRLADRMSDLRRQFKFIVDDDVLAKACSDIANMLTQLPVPIAREDLDRLTGPAARLARNMEKIPPQEHESLFWILITFSLHAFHRFELEKWLWKEFRRRWSGYGLWSMRLASNYVDDVVRHADFASDSAFVDAQQAASKEFVATLSDTPLVFLFMTRMMPESVTSLWLKDNVLERDAFTCSDDGTLTRVGTLPRHTTNNYWMAAFRPATMDSAADSTIREIIAEFLEKDWVREYVRVRLTLDD